MRKALLGSIAAVAAGAGLAAGQSPKSQPPAPVSIAPSVSGLVPVGGMDMPGGPGMGMPGMDPIMMGGQGMPGPMGPGMGGPGMTGPGMAGQGPVGPGLDGMGVDPRMMGGMPGGPGYGPGGEYPYGGGGGSVGVPRMWFNARYWLAFTRPITGAPFVTTSAPADGGLIGGNTTSVLYSTTDIGYNLISGFKIDGGLFCDADRRRGIELGGFMVGKKTVEFEAASDATGQPLLARPYVDATTGAPGALFVSFPNFAAGSVRVTTDHLSFGAELNAVSNLYRSCPGNGILWNVNASLGFRYLQIEESLDISQTTVILPGNTVPFDGKSYTGPVTIGVHDSFYTANRFYGGQFGMSAEMKCGSAFMALNGKLAIGDVHQRVVVDGNSTLRDPVTGANSTVRGGLYANASNIGTYTNDEFAVVPEGSIELGYNWCSWLSTSIGYNALYINKVVRPSDQYTLVVNPAQVPTSPSFGVGGAVPVPNPAGSQTYTWVQGVTFGLHARY
jgi:hypothetical protein